MLGITSAKIRFFPPTKIEWNNLNQELRSCETYSLFVNSTLGFMNLLGHPRIAFTIVKYHTFKNLLPGYALVQIMCENNYLNTVFKIP